MLSFYKLVKQQISVSEMNPPSESEVFHIAYGADEAFSLGTAVSLTSVLKCNGEHPIHFHIFTDTLSEACIEKFRRLREDYHFGLTLYFVDTEGLRAFPVKAKWPCSIYFRLVAIDYLSDKVEKLLYLDSDIVCRHSLRGLLSMSLEDNVVAAAIDVDDALAEERAVSLKTPEIKEKYFNSGVMLINTRQWHSQGIAQKIIRGLQDPEIKNSLLYYDQDLINIAVAGRVCLLDEKFNMQYSINDEYKDQVLPLPSDTVLLHYIGATKPWHIWAKNYLNVADFLIYKNDSPWKDVDLAEPGKKGLWKHAIKHARHQKQRMSQLKYQMRYLSFILKNMSKGKKIYKRQETGNKQSLQRS